MREPFVMHFAPEELDAREAAVAVCGKKLERFFICGFEAHAGDPFYRVNLTAYLQGTENWVPFETEFWVGNVVLKMDLKRPMGDRVTMYVSGKEMDCVPNALLSRVQGPDGRTVPVLEVGLRGRLKINVDCIVFTALTREEEKAVKHNAFRTGG